MVGETIDQSASGAHLTWPLLKDFSTTIQEGATQE